MTVRYFLASVLLVSEMVPSEAASAKDIMVHMKNSGAAGMMVFEPALVMAQPGDTVKFLPTDPGHNAETIPGMLPDGVAPAIGKINQELALKVTKAGLYGIRCKPHFGFGMIALIKVGRGRASNADAAAAVSLPTMAAKRMAPLLAAAKGK